MARRRSRVPAAKGRKAKARDSGWPALSGLSTDWYWEQDAELRFSRVDVQIGTPGEQQLARNIVGKKRWETGIQVEGGWDAHRALLQARAPFRDLLMWRDFDDGSRRYISVSGEPTFDAKGRFTGYRGVGRDVTEQKRGELLLRMEHTVTRCLAEASDAAGGIAGALRAICETEGWDCAEFWRLDPAAGDMRRFARWASPGFAECPDEGLIDTVRRSGEPLWVPDCSQDPRALRKLLPEESGARAALLCPVSMAGRVVGVLAFTCRRIRPPDEPLLEALVALASQIGLFLERTDSEARLRESEERYRRTFELAASGIAHIGLDRRFIRVNRRLCEILGYPEAELLGKTGREISHPEDLDVINALRPRLYAGEVDTVRAEKRYVRKDGSTVWVALTLALERDAAGNPHYEIAVYDDITQVMLARERIASLAYQDALTGLANRASLVPALHQAVERTKRRGSKLAGLFVDLDGFKQVNDAYGHHAGDRVLVETARRLRASLRSGDPVARLGGDEFFAVLEDVHDASPVERVAQKLLAAIREPYDLGGGQQAVVSASIGISLFPEDAGDAETLMKHADAAMYEAKQDAKNAYRFFGVRGGGAGA